MQISFASPGAIGTGALVVGVLEGGEFTPTAAKADEAAGGALKRAIGINRFKGKAVSHMEVIAPVGSKASRIVLAGLGKGEAFDAGTAEKLAATIMGRLLASGEETLTFALDLPKRAKLSDPELAAHLGFGAF